MMKLGYNLKVVLTEKTYQKDCPTCETVFY